MEVLTFLMIAMVVLVLTAAMFGGWLLVATSRGIVRFFGFLTGTTPARPRLAATSPGHVRCQRARCHAENPSAARYCRRCGKAVAASAPASAPVRRAAML